MPTRNAKTLSSAPSPVEVEAKPKRRSFTVEYKLKILEEIDDADQHGQIGAILRREGLTSSLLATWRKERDKGNLTRNAVAKRGPKSDSRQAGRTADELQALQAENERLERRVQQLEAVADIQKKLYRLLESTGLMPSGETRLPTRSMNLYPLLE